MLMISQWDFSFNRLLQHFLLPYLSGGLFYSHTPPKICSFWAFWVLLLLHNFSNDLAYHVPELMTINEINFMTGIRHKTLLWFLQTANFRGYVFSKGNRRLQCSVSNIVQRFISQSISQILFSNTPSVAIVQNWPLNLSIIKQYDFNNPQHFFIASKARGDAFLQWSHLTQHFLFQHRKKSQILCANSNTETV